MQCDTCDAIDLFLQGNFQRGRHILELRAAAGDVYALTGFGLMYQNGWGVPVDYDRAMGFYQTASRKGDLLALNQIGYLFLRGLGRKADPKSAWCSFEQAAESGFERSTQHLAEMMAAGLQPVSCKPSGAKLTDAVEDEGGVSRMALEFWNGVREGMTPDQVASVLPAPYLEKYPPTAPNSDVMVAPTVLLGLPAVARVSFVGHAAKAVVFTIDLESDDAD
jgi:TPR repeat protein